MNNQFSLDEEELDILDDYENNHYVSATLTKEEKKMLQNVAQHTLAQNRSIHIKISEKDFLDLKRTAIKEGMPYQILVSSVIHKYLSGHLKPVENIN